MGGGGAGSSSSSPAVPSLPPEILFHATGPLETAADPQPPSSTSRKKEELDQESEDEKEEEEDDGDKLEHQNNNNNNINNNNNNNNNNNHNHNSNRKRKPSSVFPPSPVSSRLRSRISSQGDGNPGCGLDCSRTCCCHYVSVENNTRHPTANPCTSPPESLSLTSLDGPNGNHYSDNIHSTLSGHTQEMEKRKRLGSDILIALADKISGRKRRKKQLLHPDDLNFLEQFGDQTLVASESRPSSKNGVAKKCRDKLSLPDVVKSRTMDDISSRKLNPTKKTLKTMAKITKDNTKMGRPDSPVLRPDDSPVHDVKNLSSQLAIKTESKRGRSKSRSPLVPPVSSSSPALRWSNGWSWEGHSFYSLVHLRNEDVPATRKCYPAMRHTQGDVVRVRDCILLKSGPKAKDLPFVAKVSALWENAEDGEMMMSLLWYYRPEHTEGGRRTSDLDDEIFASRHRDVCSVACIEDKCYVLTFNEYCRCVLFIFLIFKTFTLNLFFGSNNQHVFWPR